MVIMASGIARGRVRTTTVTTVVESRKMAVILQIIGWQGHEALPCIRLARGKFELTNQDSVDGKNSSVLM